MGDAWERLRQLTLDQLVTFVKLNGSALLEEGFTTPEGWPFAVVVAVGKPGDERAVELAKEFAGKLGALAPVKAAARRAEGPCDG